MQHGQRVRRRPTHLCHRATRQHLTVQIEQTEMVVNSSTTLPSIAMNSPSSARKLRCGVCSEASKMENKHHVCHWQRSVWILDSIDIHLVRGRTAWKLLEGISTMNEGKSRMTSIEWHPALVVWQPRPGRPPTTALSPFRECDGISSDAAHRWPSW